MQRLHANSYISYFFIVLLDDYNLLTRSWHSVKQRSNLLILQSCDLIPGKDRTCKMGFGNQIARVNYLTWAIQRSCTILFQVQTEHQFSEHGTFRRDLGCALSLNLSVNFTKSSQVRTWKITKFMKGALINSNLHHTSRYIGAILNFCSNFLLYSNISSVFLIKIAGN